MKRTFIILTISTLIFFWTAIHKFGGDPGYELVLKPYPSFDIFVGGGEEWSYNQRMENGEFPWWLTDNAYIKLAYGDWESKTHIWEYIRYSAIILTIIGWPIFASVCIFKLIRRKLNKSVPSNTK